MKILHIGDVHLREWEGLEDTTQALLDLQGVIVEHAVDLVLIPGDLYDRKTTAHERALMAELLDGFAPVPVLIARGNHDTAEDLLPLALAPHIRVFERPELVSIGGIDVLAVPWPERAHLAAAGYTGEGGLQAAQAALGDLIRGMAATRIDKARPLVIMGHLSVVGALSSSGQPLVGREIQVVAQDLIDTGAHYVGLNHIHKPQEIHPGLVYYAGSLTVQNFGEEGEDKSVLLVDVLPGGCIFQKINVLGRAWVTVCATLQGEPGREEIVEVVGEARARLDSIFLSTEGLNVRYCYSCNEDQEARFDHAEIGRRFSGAYTLKIVPNVTRSARVRAVEVSEAKTNAEKLRAWGSVTGTEITQSLLGKLEDLEGVKHG